MFMDYSLDRLTTVEECDSMVQIAQEAKDDFLYEKSSIAHRSTNYEERSVKHETDLAAVTAELSSLNGVIGSLPEGPVKKEIQSRIKRLDYRQWLLEERSDTYGALALLEQQLSIAQMDAQIAEIDAFIAEVNTHKAGL